MYKLMCPRAHRNWVLPRYLCNHLGQSPCAPSIHHFVFAVMSTQKTLFDIFQPSMMKLTRPCLTDRKESLLKIFRRFRDPGNVSFSFKWREEFAWLVYVSTENHMKCKTCECICTFSQTITRFLAWCN